MRYIIGVDIGGTNTDGVLIDDKGNVICWKKTVTTVPIEQGVEEVLKALTCEIALDEIQEIIMGTTHALNAVLERKELYKVGLIRLAAQRPCFPAAAHWPQDLKEAVLIGQETVDGGLHCDGQAMAPLHPDEIQKALLRLKSQGMESLAIVGVFSFLQGEQEISVEKIARSLFGQEFPITLSHEIGSLGFIERENATLLNAALKKPLGTGFRRLKELLHKEGFHCPLFLTQNNGTLLTINKALEFPILTLSSGPTNSFVGAAKLAGFTEAIVVDIGGTSTDVGLIEAGFPKRSLKKGSLGGVSLNFPMPDFQSIALGGGSYVCLEQGMIGPHSAGRCLQDEAIHFGGTHLTLFDLLTDRFFETDLLIKKAVQDIEDLVRMMSHKNDLPIVMVGGTAPLFKDFFDPKRYHFPPLGSVANAYGASLAEIASTEEKVVSPTPYEIEALQAKAISSAISQGVDPDKVRLVSLNVIPYSYLPGALARVIAMAAGPRK